MSTIAGERPDLPIGRAFVAGDAHVELKMEPGMGFEPTTC
jgi:hypothetical protein